MTFFIFLALGLAPVRGATPTGNTNQGVHERTAFIDQSGGGALETFYNSDQGWVRFQYCQHEYCTALHAGNLDVRNMDIYQRPLVEALAKLKTKLKDEHENNLFIRWWWGSLEKNPNYSAVAKILAK